MELFKSNDQTNNLDKDDPTFPMQPRLSLKPPVHCCSCTHRLQGENRLPDACPPQPKLHLKWKTHLFNEGVCCNFTTNKGITALTQTPATTKTESPDELPVGQNSLVLSLPSACLMWWVLHPTGPHWARAAPWAGGRDTLRGASSPALATGPQCTSGSGSGSDLYDVPPATMQFINQASE